MSYGAIYPYTWWGSPIKDGWGGVYYDFAYSYLLNKYGGAAAAYSLRQLSADATNVVRVRRDSDNEERDFRATEVSDGTLQSWVNGELDALPLDTATAAAAYSLRNLKTSYSGSVVRVRRSSDNAEADFTAAEVSDGTLESWVGTSGTDNGFVTTWYDQAGSNNATQATASSQPKIVDAGSLVTENGKASIDFDGVNDGMILNPSFNLSNFSTSLVFSANTGQDSVIFEIRQGPSDWFAFGIGDKGTNDAYGTSFAVSAIVYNVGESGVSGQKIAFHIGNQSPANIDLYLNNITATGSQSSRAGVAGTSTLGYRSGGGNPTNAKIQEFVIYESDQSSNRVKIENNINTYYNIYSSLIDGYVATWYDQSGNSNDATQATASAQPMIVDSGVLVRQGGRASLKPIDGTTGLDISYTGSADFYSFAVGKVALDDESVLYSGDNTGKYILAADEGDTSVASGGAGTPIYYKNGDVITFTNRGDVYNKLNNQSLITIDADTSTWAALQLGYPYNNIFGMYNLQEVVIYNTDQSANKSDIESNINTYYTIYPEDAISGLLFDYPNAAAAYSVRQLTLYSNDYKETLVRVRRSSDNAEVDVKADSNYEISLNSDTSSGLSLGDWIGSDDGYVVTWYDQSGNDNDATQATASSQPQLISGGVVNLENGKAALDFDGSDDTLTTASFSLISQPFSSFSVSKESISNDAIFGSVTSAVGEKFVIYNVGGNYTLFNGKNGASTIPFTTNQKIISSLSNGTNSELYLNSSTGTTNIDSGTDGFKDIRISGYYTPFVQPLDGILQEIIIYPSDQSANRTNIETNINDYFNIY